MRYSLFFFALFMSTPAMAQQTLYTDLNVGIGFAPDIVLDVDYVNGDDMATGLISASAESALTFGGEVGVRGVGSKHLSFGVSADYFEANLQDIMASGSGVISDIPFDLEAFADSDSLTVSGTYDGMPIDETFLLDEFDISSIDLDTELVTLMGNLRYDFVGPTERFQPYIAVGGGLTFIKDWDKATTLGATIGVKMKMTNSFYTGIRYRYIRMFDVTDVYLSDYIAFDRRDTSMHLITFTFGGSPYYGQ